MKYLTRTLQTGIGKNVRQIRAKEKNLNPF